MRLGVAAALVGGELIDGDVEVVDGRIARNVADADEAEAAWRSEQAALA